MSVYAYQITADSGCDLSLEKCAERGVMPYKMPFTMDGKPMTDGMTEESFREFYDLMRAGGIARTSQINPGEFTEFWRPLAEAGKNVLHISLAAAISGSCDNARSAAAMLMEEYPGWTCRVVDSTNASAGFGLVVLRAADNRDKGLSLADNADELESMVHNTNSIFTTNDLTYLYRGGRVSKTAAFLGTMISLKPLLHVDDEGHLIPLSKVRGRKKSLIALVDAMEKQIGSWRDKNDIIFISHGDCIEDAQYVADLIKDRFGYESFLINHVGPTIGAHTGPGVVALFYMGDYR